MISTRKGSVNEDSSDSQDASGQETFKFLGLPGDLQRHFLSYLDAYMLCQMSSLSKRCYIIANENSLWQKLQAEEPFVLPLTPVSVIILNKLLLICRGCNY